MGPDQCLAHSLGGWGGVFDAPALPGETGAFCPSHPDVNDPGTELAP
jgi:hypothetical protein